jgi:hypothetical protein
MMSLKRCSAFAVAAGLTFIFGIPGPSSRLPELPHATAAFAATQSAPCGCPQLPVVATSDKPADGSVHFELRFTDLEAIFSNRHLLYAGDWEDGFVALAHAVDPGGRYGIWSKPAPKPIRTVGIDEGGLTRFMLNPAAYGPGQRSPTQLYRPGMSRWANDRDVRSFMFPVLYTLARINKYGEPAKGLRAAVLSGSRFLAQDLARIPIDLALRDPKAGTLRDLGQGARSVVTTALTQLHPKNLARGAPRGVGQSGELPLDAFDIANAALDIILSADSSGRLSPLIGTTTDAEDRSLFTILVNIASERAQFGGSAPPGSSQDAVACRAFSTLMAFADVKTAASDVVRTELLNVYGEEIGGTGPGGPPRLKVAQVGLIMAGTASVKEAMATVQSIFEMGFTNQNNNRWQEVVQTTATTLQMLATRAGPDPGTYRREIAAGIQDRIEQLQGRQRTGTGSLDERRLMEALKAGATTQLAAVFSPCGPTPGETKGRIFLYAVCVDGLQSIKHAYVGVPMIVEAQFDPPSGSAEETVDVTFGAASTKMTLQRFDEKGYIYRSDAFVPQGASLKKEDVFTPASPPKGGQ